MRNVTIDSLLEDNYHNQLIEVSMQCANIKNMRLYY